LARRRERARAQIERRLARAADPGQLALDTPLGAPWAVALYCRPGLASVLAEEVRVRAPVVRGPERVEIRHAGTLGELLDARTAVEVALVSPLKRPNGLSVAEHIAGALSQAPCQAAFAAWTHGTPRFRVSWTSGGHQRALTWALASA